MAISLSIACVNENILDVLLAQETANGSGVLPGELEVSPDQPQAWSQSSEHA